MIRNVVNAAILTSMDTANNTGDFLPFETAAAAVSPLPGATFMITFVNNSNEDMTISYDGVNPHDFVPKATSRQLSFQTNNQPSNQYALLPKGLQIYASGAAGIGLIYLSAYYQPTQI